MAASKSPRRRNFAVASDYIKPLLDQHFQVSIKEFQTLARQVLHEQRGSTSNGDLSKQDRESKESPLTGEFGGVVYNKTTAVSAHFEIIFLEKEGILTGCTPIQRCAVSRDAVVRHRRHLPAVLAHAQEVKEVAHGDSLLAQLRELTSEAQRLKVIAEQAGDYRAALAAVRELCRIVELMAKLSGELESHSETKILNVTLDAESARRISETFLARHQPLLEST
jgi:hypothetical protein